MLFMRVLRVELLMQYQDIMLTVCAAGHRRSGFITLEITQAIIHFYFQILSKLLMACRMHLTGGTMQTASSKLVLTCS